MKKIKSIQQLKAKKKMLAKRRAELEKAIHYDWLDVKNSLQPKNLAGSIFSSNDENQQTSESFLSSLAAKAAGNVVKRAEEKLLKWLKKK